MNTDLIAICIAFGLFCLAVVHDDKHDTWEVIEDDSALVDWSGDIDTKPRYDRIRTMEQVISKKETSASDVIDKKGGEQ